jgi:dihydrofolate reductase
MRMILVFENISVDGFMAGPHSELDWAIHDDEVTELSQEGHASTDLFMFGRITYEMMAGFWPTPAGRSSNPVFAEMMNNTPKVVFSRTLRNASWNKTMLLKDIDREAILKLKEQPGRNIMIFGSGSIVGQLAGLGLVDEYQLMLNPVVLGSGKSLFKEMPRRMCLRLAGSRTFNSGIVLLRYQPVK